MKGIDTERIECCHKDQEGRESMPQGERQVDPKLIVNILRSMVLLDNVVDMWDRGTDEQRKDEGDDVAAMSPEIDVDRIEKDEERQAPVDSVDDDLLAIVKKLIGNGAKE